MVRRTLVGLGTAALLVGGGAAGGASAVAAPVAKTSSGSADSATAASMMSAKRVKCGISHRFTDAYFRNCTRYPVILKVKLRFTTDHCRKVKPGETYHVKDLLVPRLQVVKRMC